MFRLDVSSVAILLLVLIAPVASLAANDRPIPPTDPKSPEDCRAYQQREIDYSRVAIQKSRECFAKSQAANNEDMVLYQSSCGRNVLSAFRSCRELSDAAWCALAGVSEKITACFEKVDAAEQKRPADVLAQNENQQKIETEKLLPGHDAAAQSATDELEEALQRERERASQSEPEVLGTQRNLDTKAALAANAKDEAGKLKATETSATELRKSLQQEHEKNEALARDLSMARAKIYAYEAQAHKADDQVQDRRQVGADVLCKSLQQDQEHSSGLERDLAAARRDIEAQTALAARATDDASRARQAADDKAAELRKSLQQEQDRALRLEQDLAAARREIETQAALAAKAAAEAARAKQAADDTSTESLRLLQQEREKTSKLERELAAGGNSRKGVPAAAGALSTGRVVQDKQPGPGATRPVTMTQPAASVVRSSAGLDPGKAAEVARLVARASVLLGQGDIGSARIVLERAAETGSAQASFALAETYDPLVLRKWGAYGTLGDAAKALDLYARAQVGGIKEAKERFDALRR